MNTETLKKPWVIALIVLAMLGLIAVGFLGSRMILGNQFREGGFPRASIGAAPLLGGGERVGGEILAVDDAQLTIKSPDGESFEFSITDETEISIGGGMEALEEGAFALVQYESAEDGSLVALTINGQRDGQPGRIGPAEGGRGPGGGQGQK